MLAAVHQRLVFVLFMKLGSEPGFSSNTHFNAVRHIRRMSRSLKRDGGFSVEEDQNIAAQDKPI